MSVKFLIKKLKCSDDFKKVTDVLICYNCTNVNNFNIYNTHYQRYTKKSYPCNIKLIKSLKV